MRFRITDLKRLKQNKQPIVAVTAYDYSSAFIAERSGVDVILVGDSLGTVIQGRENTLNVKMEHMIYHTEMVSRACKKTLVIADMPFLSYQVSIDEALKNAGRLIQDAGAHAVKLEGGNEYVNLIKKLVSIGIPVIGHLGLTPQSYLTLGGYRVQGRTPDQAKEILDEATALQEAGISALVLEAIPSELAQEITEKLEIPTIGIGAGIECNGQVLVFHDLLGLSSLVDNEVPKFVKVYAELGKLSTEAISQYVSDVRTRKFPEDKHSYISSGPRLVR